jgi:hypothetical protein
MLTLIAKLRTCKLPFKPAMEDGDVSGHRVRAVATHQVEDERQCRANEKEKEVAHGVGGLGGGDGLTCAAGDSGLYNDITDRATSLTVVTRLGEHLILFLSAYNFMKR